MGRHKKRNLFKLKLKNDTIYTLFCICLFLFSALLLFSYTKNGEFLSTTNRYLVYFFGLFGFFIPFNILLFALLLTRIKSKFTKPTFFLGFLIMTLSSVSLFKQGYVGILIFANTDALLGGILSNIIFFVGIFLGLSIFFNLSISQVFSVISKSLSFVGVFISQRIFPLLKTKKSTNDIDQIKIKGLKDTPTSSESHSQPPVVAAAKKDLSDDIILNEPLEMGVWEYPPLSLLSEHADKKKDTGDVKKTAAIIENTLQSFRIQAKIIEINMGPSVTQYAIRIAQGTKLSKVTALANDLALATEAPTGQIRIEAPIPGRDLVGIEVPNRGLEMVGLKRMLESSQMQKAKSKTIVPLGLDVSGNPVVADIAKMPHVLVAGTTGSGKSVLVNSIISSLLFRASPSEVKMILIDPKRVELTGYNDIPHLLTPVVVDADKSVSALKWALKEMDRRYIKFADAGVRNIDSFNELSGFQALPYLIIFIDELADLMALAPVEVEDSIARLAQMARATGIHLVLSTQRPSVDVITGLIKANIPCRIAFNVSSMVDSKVIIDTPGAEKLLGRGDMLYVPPDQAKPTRIQGTFVSDQDVKRLVNFIKSRGIPVQYTTEVVEQPVNLKRGGVTYSSDGSVHDDQDELFEQAVRIVCQYDRASSSLLQRKLSIGFNRAARIIEQLEAAGVVGPGDGSKPRDVIVKNPEEILNRST